MTRIPPIPANAPFTTEQRAWLNGYLAAVFGAEGDAETSGSAGPARALEPFLILFGSQTGTAEGLAKRVAREAAAKGFNATVAALNDHATAGLMSARKLLIITSTWGDGDPPDNATGFWSWLSTDPAPDLKGLSFAVLGLGDRNYTDFCGISKKMDARLEACGAKRLTERGECDVDYETTAKGWLEQFWGVAADSATPSSPNTEKAEAAGTKAGDVPTGWSRINPFPATLKTNRKLSGAGSAKDVRHFEIVLDGSALEYEVGDALGVVPRNCPALVEELLAALHLTGEELVADPAGKQINLHEALMGSYVITTPPPSLVKEAVTRAARSELIGLLEPARKSELDAWLYGRDIVDLLKACSGARFEPVELTGFLRKLQPRLYSISSSPKAHPGEVHLTVATVRYEAHGRTHKGVASCWLADRVVCGESPVPVFIQKSHGFRLPEDGSKPVIMIGPGTGIAPFRAFLEERKATGATGGNWLFFGDQCRAHDYLYEKELTAFQQEGVLTRLDLAFSRDQAEKIYVQTRMGEAAVEIWKWLGAGAHVYVCGDARRMAKDVDQMLHSICAETGGLGREGAVAFVEQLKKEKRYQRDVY